MFMLVLLLLPGMPVDGNLVRKEFSLELYTGKTKANLQIDRKTKSKFTDCLHVLSYAPNDPVFFRVYQLFLSCI